jgi:hypothetical protein
MNTFQSFHELRKDLQLDVQQTAMRMLVQSACWLTGSIVCRIFHNVLVRASSLANLSAAFAQGFVA